MLNNKIVKNNKTKIESQSQDDLKFLLNKMYKSIDKMAVRLKNVWESIYKQIRAMNTWSIATLTVWLSVFLLVISINPTRIWSAKEIQKVNDITVSSIVNEINERDEYWRWWTIVITSVSEVKAETVSTDWVELWNIASVLETIPNVKIVSINKDNGVITKVVYVSQDNNDSLWIVEKQANTTINIEFSDN